MVRVVFFVSCVGLVGGCASPPENTSKPPTLEIEFWQNDRKILLQPGNVVELDPHPFTLRMRGPVDSVSFSTTEDAFPESDLGKYTGPVLVPLSRGSLNTILGELRIYPDANFSLKTDSTAVRISGLPSLALV